MMRWAGLAALCFSLNVAPASFASPWETLSGCRLKASDWNDGDSFHVVHGGREFLFRLCYVDCPETRSHRELVDRTTAQAKYWKIKKKDLFALAAEASEFTGAELAAPFTVRTQWEDAKGQSQLPRYFAVIGTAGGKDLAELLVARGYSRVFGFMPPRPDGQSAHDYGEKLKKIELGAQADKAGAWGYSSRTSPPKKAPKQKKGSSNPSPSPSPHRAKTSALSDLPAI